MIAYLKNKGVSSIMGIVIITIGSILASAITAFATSSNAISKVETKVDVVSERESNHYQEVEKSLLRIESGINELRTKQ